MLDAFVVLTPVHSRLSNVDFYKLDNTSTGGKNLLCVCVSVCVVVVFCLFCFSLFLFVCLVSLLLFLIHIDTSCESFALGAPFNKMCSDLTFCALWKRKKAALKVLTTDRAWGTRVEGLTVQFFSGTGVTTVAGLRVVTATSSFARDRAARDGHLTPAFP